MMQSCQSEDTQMKFNFARCVKLISGSKRNCTNIDGQDVILFLGKTGVGKSTLIHYLCGSRMENQVVDRLSHIGPVDVSDTSLMEIKTSPHKRSETRYLSSVWLPYSNVGIERDGGILLCDTPGFEDTGGAEIDIANTFSLLESLKSASSVRVVILFSQDVGRGESFRAGAHLLVKLVKDIARYIDTFSFVFTKRTPQQLLEVHAELHSIKEHLSEHEKADLGFMSLLEAMLEDTENRVLSFNPLQGKSGAKKFLRTLLKKEVIKRPGEVFCFSASEKSMQLLHEQLEEGQKALKNALLNDNTAIVEDIIKELIEIQKYIPLEEIKSCYESSLKLVQYRVEVLYQQADNYLDSFIETLSSKKSVENYVELHQKLFLYEAIQVPYLKRFSTDWLLSKIQSVFSNTPVSKIEQGVLENLQRISFTIHSFQEIYSEQKKRVDDQAKDVSCVSQAENYRIVSEQGLIEQSVSLFIDNIETILQQSNSSLKFVKEKFTQECLEYFSSLSQLPQYCGRLTVLISQIKSILNERISAMAANFERTLDESSLVLSVNHEVSSSWVNVLKKLYFLKDSVSLLHFSDLLTKVVNKIERNWLPLRYDTQRILTEDELKKINWIINCFEHLSFIEDAFFLDYKKSYFDWLKEHEVFYETLFDKTFSLDKLEISRYQLLDRCHKMYATYVTKTANKEADVFLLANASLSINELNTQIQELLSIEATLVSRLLEQEKEKEFLLITRSKIQMIKREFTEILPINSNRYVFWYVTNSFLTNIHMKDSPWETASILLEKNGYCSFNALGNRLAEVVQAIEEIEAKHVELKEELVRTREEEGRLSALKLAYLEQVESNTQHRRKKFLSALSKYLLPTAEAVCDKLSQFDFDELFQINLMENQIASSIPQYEKVNYFRGIIPRVNHAISVFSARFSATIEEILKTFLLGWYECDKEISLFTMPLLIEYIKLADSAFLFRGDYRNTLLQDLAYRNLLFSDRFYELKSSGSLVDCFQFIEQLRIMSACDGYLKKAIFHSLFVECSDSLNHYIVNLGKQIRCDFNARQYGSVKIIVDQLRSAIGNEIIRAELEKLKIFILSSVQKQCLDIKEDLITLRTPVSYNNCRKIIGDVRAIKELIVTFVSDDVFLLLDILQNTLKFSEEKFNYLLKNTLNTIQSHMMDRDVNFQLIEDRLWGITTVISMAQDVLPLASIVNELPILRKKIINILEEIASFYVSADLKTLINRPLINFHENILPLIHDSSHLIYKETWSTIEEAAIRKFNDAFGIAALQEGDKEEDFFRAVLRSFPIYIREHLSINLDEKEHGSHYSRQHTLKF